MSQIRTVGIVGVGLIGASLGLALRERRAVERVIGVDVDRQALDVGQARGAIDAVATIDQLNAADLVVIAVPPRSVVAVAMAAAAGMRDAAMLMDVASTKREIVAELDERLPAQVRYVGGHPMAGAQGHGPEAADAGLLAGRPFLLTPTSKTDPAVLQAMREFVERLGMHPILLTPDDHDELVAQISHVPYLVAVASVNAATADALPLHGPAFADVARVAGSPTDLWIDICRGNRAAIRHALAAFRREVDRLEQALDDEASLKTVLESSRRRARALYPNDVSGTGKELS